MIKYLTIVLFSLSFWLTGCDTASRTEKKNDQIEEADSIDSAQEGDSYGEVISPDGAKDLEWLTASIQPGDSLLVKVSGEINKTCPMKGCWMTMDSPAGEVRVTFRDYGFFVPKEGMEGKKAVVKGYAVKKVVDVETLRHFAKDAGKSPEEIAAITQPREEVALVADGVVIL